MSRTLMPHTYDLETLRALHAGGASAATEPAIPSDLATVTEPTVGKWSPRATTRTRFDSSTTGKNAGSRRNTRK